MKIDDLFDFEFDKSENCQSVTGYYGKSEELIFPESYKGKPVKIIKAVTLLMSLQLIV